MKTNKTTKGTGEVLLTAEGGKAVRTSAENQLRRSIMACMLWENSFYEDGVAIADRISNLVTKVDPSKVAEIAIAARNEQKLRHAPLLLAKAMAGMTAAHKLYVAEVLDNVIQRPDELTEFLSLYWKNGKCPIANQVKKGLASAFTKFNEYQLAKYNRDETIKLRDVLFMVHAKPKDEDQEKLWKRLVNNELKTPDTWEVALSSGADKKDTFERLIKERKLGAMAFLRNLRNMLEAGISTSFIEDHLDNLNVEKVLPFRFITAAKYNPVLEASLEKLMFKCLEGHDKLKGRTALVIDVSGSMDAPISSKSELTRIDAGCALAMLLREVSDKIDIYTFSSDTKLVPARRGFALRDGIIKSQPHASTYLAKSLKEIDSNKTKYDRYIVITDEQSQDGIHNVACEDKYLINVASDKNGVGYGPWVHVDGWSEAIVNYILAYEKYI